uniref:Uncharacterized protein n=1 Tax=Rhizophora mucronata TaxID=61149 RepID=A0A2P2QHY6_RHIMU
MPLYHFQRSFQFMAQDQLVHSLLLLVDQESFPLFAQRQLPETDQHQIHQFTSLCHPELHHLP